MFCEEYTDYREGETRYADTNISGVYFLGGGGGGALKSCVQTGNVNRNLRHTVIHTPLIQFAIRLFVTLRKLKLMKVWTLLVKTRYSKYYQ